MRNFFINYILRDYFARSNIGRDGYTFDTFEQENFNSKNGFNSNAISGYIVYKDEFGTRRRCEPMVIKLSPNPNLRTRYMDVSFCNEIFMYNRIIPFYAALDSSIMSLLPKFYYGNVILGGGHEENASIILENLSNQGYRSLNDEIFLDFQHLVLIVKKLAGFHAFSYYAKSKEPCKFYSLVDNLVNMHIVTTREGYGYFNLTIDHYLKMLENDAHYGTKIDGIREILKNADEFMEDVFTDREEPTAVLCHGDFLHNNLMLKYDSSGHPTDVKFIDFSFAKYCTPVVDLALILYMNADQKMRHDHWDDLLDVYWTTLRDTFPQVVTPTKAQILNKFKGKALNAFVLTTFFLPFLMRARETTYNGEEEFWHPEYAEYVNAPWYDTPSQVRFGVLRKALKPEHAQKVLEVVKDIVDRGFV